MTRVIDASVAIAALLAESGAETADRAMAGGVMSSVNYSEVIARLVRRGMSDDLAIDTAEGLGLTIAPFERDAAVHTAVLSRVTRQKGLSLGDRACLALAQQLNASAVTADRAWAELDLGIAVEVIR